MICVSKICKSFDENIIFKDYSYTFNDTGLYVLLGESGSGKTTLLNILAGLTRFQSGSITINGIQYQNQVSPDASVEYMTQDSSFIDFISMQDNLRLVAEDETIYNAAKEFGISELLSHEPPMLSGGQRQRFALIRALLNKKKILLLDEPTASLDEENTRLMMSQLRKMKEDTLIIMASHDPIVAEYADYLIGVSKIHHSCKETSDNTDSDHNKFSFPVTHFNSVKPYLKKWFSSKYRHKKSEHYFVLFMTIAFIICSFVTPVPKKIKATLNESYQIHSCYLRAENNPSIIERLSSDESISEVILPYNENIPVVIGDSTQVFPALPYEVSVGVLPYSQDLFLISDKIKYGTYYTDKNQIILSEEAAKKLMNGKENQLIGKKISKNFYGLGVVEMTIVGILGDLNDFDRAYLNSFGSHYQIGSNYNPDNYTAVYFVNNMFTAQLQNDESFCSEGKRTYELVFNSYSEMINYYDNMSAEWKKDRDGLFLFTIDAGLRELFAITFYTMMPLCVLIALFSIVFYCNLIYVETMYQSGFLSVFEYLGYSIKKVLHEYQRLHFERLCKLLGISAILSFTFVFIINIINQQMVLVPFHLITPWLVFLGGFSICVFGVGYCCLSFFIRKIRYDSWYSILIKQKDLL